MASEVIELTGTEDLRDAVHRAVACLTRGGVVGLPTETAYALMASALNPEAVARLRELSGRRADEPLPICLRGPDELEDWVPRPGEIGRRLARRGWPGPIALSFPVGPDEGFAARLPEPARSLIRPSGTLALRSPLHPFVQDVAGLVSGPVLLAGGPWGADVGKLRGVEGLDLLVDDGPTELRGGTTWVRVAPEGWEVSRPGAVPEEHLQRLAGTIILFVCTGNTCRSPMAEGICRRLLAEKLGCAPEELAGRGYIIESAGVSAGRGDPATPEAVEAAATRGASLVEHRSRPVTYELAEQADIIIAMTSGHLSLLLSRLPELAGRARLLRDDGEDIDDPYGSDRRVYARTAAEIERQLRKLIDDIVGG